MATYLNSFYLELQQTVLSAWTDVVTGGAWETEPLEAMTWDDLTTPYAAMYASDFAVDEDYGCANEQYQGDVSIFYVAATQGIGDNLRQKIMDLNAALQTASNTYYRCLLITELNWSNDMPPNSVFIQRNDPYRAGKVTFKALVGNA